MSIERREKTEKTRKQRGGKSLFRSERQLLQRVEDYIAFCGTGERVRLPNVAGFCRFCRLTREEFGELRLLFPRGYDLALSAFLDEALNTKLLNSAQSLAFLQKLAEGGEEREFGEVACIGEAFADGA